MTKFKRFAALAAVMMLGIQILGAGTAFATAVDGQCDFGSSDLEITLGSINGTRGGANTSEAGDVELYIDGTNLKCKDFETGGGASPTKSQALSTIESITVEMDDVDDSTGSLFILLKDGASTNVSEWPAFDSFDIDVTTKVFIKGTGIAGSSGGLTAANNFHVVIGSDSLSFLGATATSNAPAYSVVGGGGNDMIDASKATAKITADGGDGNDVIKGGSGGDVIVGGDGTSDGKDVLYGGAGNDSLTGDGVGSSLGVGSDSCYGGAGNDDIISCSLAAPGTGDDLVSGATSQFFKVSYADVTGDVEWVFGESDGAAGSDSVTAGTSGDILAVIGGSGDDVMLDNGDLYGGPGDDALKSAADAMGGTGDDLIVSLDWYDGAPDSPTSPTNGGAALVGNHFFGNAGSDVLKGKGGNDTLRGGPGKDQAWGGGGSGDYCNAEVTNRCEVGKV